MTKDTSVHPKTVPAGMYSNRGDKPASHIITIDDGGKITLHDLTPKYDDMFIKVRHNEYRRVRCFDGFQLMSAKQLSHAPEDMDHHVVGLLDGTWWVIHEGTEEECRQFLRGIGVDVEVSNE